MKILINSVAAKMGGASNYVTELSRNVSALNAVDEFLFLVPSGSARAIATSGENVTVLECGAFGLPGRIFLDQLWVRGLLKREGIDALYSSANFAMFACPCRQVLLVRNALYFSCEYLQRILPHKTKRTRLEIELRRWLNCRSIEVSDLVMTPTRAMMDDVRQFVEVPERKALINHYGVDVERFRPQENGDRRKQKSGPVRLLFSSLYGEHKNLATLFRAAALLANSKFEFQLITPADPRAADAQWTCTWKEDAELAAAPELINRIEFVPKRTSDEMPALYWSSDIFVYPSPVESFGHPLMEALAAELPVVAADTPLNRELAGDAAIYFAPYDPHDFADKIRQVAESPELQSRLVASGRKRCSRFTWHAHVERLLQAFAGTSIAVPQANQFAGEAAQ